jgi:hypothetical protein
MQVFTVTDLHFVNCVNFSYKNDVRFVVPMVVLIKLQVFGSANTEMVGGATAYWLSAKAMCRRK